MQPTKKNLNLNAFLKIILYQLPVQVAMQIKLRNNLQEHLKVPMFLFSPILFLHGF